MAGAIMIAIQNFGMLWERELVDWGKPRNKGSLSGIRAKKRRAVPVDFRNQTGIYVLYDENRVPIWIGQAKSLFSRLQQHRRDHLWNRWTYFTWFGFRGVNTNGTLRNSDKLDWGVAGTAADARNEVEAVLIQVLEPRLNRRGSNWGKTVEYLQCQLGSMDEDHEEDADDS